MIQSTSKNEDFEILVNNLLIAYRQFCLNKKIHEEVKTELYEKFRPTWNAILLSLEEGYLLGLAKFFERPSSQNDTISIYQFLDDGFTGHEDVIGKVKTIRDKMLAHIDAPEMRKKDGFLKELGLKRNDIGILFAATIKVVNQLREKFGLSGDLSQRFRQEEADAQNEFLEWFAPFKEKGN